MRTKKIIEIDNIVCDFCDKTSEKDFFETCNICNKDICSDHIYFVSNKKNEKAFLCPDCVKKIGIKMRGLNEK